jgi:hypothetical protein
MVAASLTVRKCSHKLKIDMKMTAFCYFTPCSIIEIGLRFKGAYASIIRAPRRIVSEGCRLHTCGHEDLNSRFVYRYF